MTGKNLFKLPEVVSAICETQNGRQVSEVNNRLRGLIQRRTITPDLLAKASGSPAQFSEATVLKIAVLMLITDSGVSGRILDQYWDCLGEHAEAATSGLLKGQSWEFRFSLARQVGDPEVGRIYVWGNLYPSDTAESTAPNLDHFMSFNELEFIGSRSVIDLNKVALPILQALIGAA